MDAYYRFGIGSRIIYRRGSFRRVVMDNGKEIPDMTEGIVLPHEDREREPEELFVRFADFGDMKIHYRCLESIL